MLHGIIKAIDIRLDYDMEKEIFFPMDYETHPEDVHEINVLTDATESSTDRSYADDCLIFCEHPNADNCTWLVNNCLEIIYEWGLAHGLTFNPSKSEAMIITKKRKFNIPNMKINLSVTNENDTCFQHQHYYHIYTDGSKFENYVGAAFVVFSVHENRIPFLRKMFRLDNRCSIYQAELLAVVEAINWVVDNNVPGVKIMSDSQAVLLSIQKIYSSNRMVQHIFQKIVNFNGHICFEWVKAHNGNFGNELADYLAKRAVESPILNYDLLPLSFFKYEFKKQLYCAWNEIWTTCSNGSTTKKFFPLVSIRSGINLSPDFILTQFLTAIIL
ncbi:hypothetical protein DERF_015048 [Dermatophagoides farinae]|uniref:ribonuclease H n=1 Tax=Dermatophagoides farinae TaxID=6954 RepID=A0A922HKN2_DERFA|nr:hypothetical protein DERF_015048 [Dermatophagoides farinae]